MTFPDLQRLVAQGEGMQLEFKAKLPEWAKLAREMVAFANSKGGIVLIGVDDDGTISGLKDPREIEEAIEINTPLYVRPLFTWTMESVPLSRKRAVVALHVPASKSKPHFALASAADPKGQVLIRIADSSVKASKESVELLKFQGRERNMKVEYGEKERILMQYLSTAHSVTVPEFARIARIPRLVASRTLVHLVKANVLIHSPEIEVDDRFLPKEG